MHENFCCVTGLQVSDSFYYKAFKELNISHAKLGNEKCEQCHLFEQHKKDCKCEILCEFYTRQAKHQRRYRVARPSYESDSNSQQSPTSPIFEADMQKVLLLPQMDQLKKIIFTPRLSIFNETFAEVGVKTKKIKHHGDICVVWHEAIQGRNDEDVCSAFHHFLKQQRGAEEITLWLDNCSYQNKNWTLITMIYHLIQSDTICAQKITLKYFEPGHTFNAADPVHSRIEGTLRTKQGKVFDLDDLEKCLQDSGCKVSMMQATDFIKWESGVSNYKLAQTEPRPYLAEMMLIQFRREEPDTFFYKEIHDGERIQVKDFLKKSFVVKEENQKVRSLLKSKKDRIVQDLLPFMPKNRTKFWSSLPESSKAKDLNTSRF